MAAPEGEREARKRRERRDSGCTHERKERRPHSEERTPPPPPPPPLHDCNRLESERRAERLSRARRPQYGGKRRRAPVRIPKQPKENECFTTTEDTRCSTPTPFDYAQLQKTQIVSDEPETLDAGALQRVVGRPASAEGSEGPDEGAASESARAAAAERARSDERSVAPRPFTRRDQPCPEKRLEKINKKISVLKKSISKYESEYESKNGHLLTPSDRLTDVQLIRMNESLRRLQAEKRCIKSDPVEYALKVQAAKQQKERDDKLDTVLKSDKPMSDVVRDIEEWLEGCRQADGRSTFPENTWTASHLASEKLCVQKVLLRLEASRGRPPAHSADRGAARHLYERYRAVKRALAITRPDAVIGANGELATIHEHEPMLFNSSVDSSSDSQEKPSESEQETIETPLQSPPTREGAGGVGAGAGGTEEVPSSTSSAQSGTSEEAAPSNEGLHCLGLDDLARALAEAKLQKCVLRRSIKEYEDSVMTAVGCLYNDKAISDSFNKLSRINSSESFVDAGMALCGQRRKILPCHYRLLQVFSPCSPPAVQEQIDNMYAAFVELADYVCDNDCKTLRGFVEDQGFECLNDKEDMLSHCAANMTDLTTELPEDTTTFVAIDTCYRYDSMVTCINEVLQSCPKKSTLHILNDLFARFRKGTYCHITLPLEKDEDENGNEETPGKNVENNKL